MGLGFSLWVKWVLLAYWRNSLVTEDMVEILIIKYSNSLIINLSGYFSSPLASCYGVDGDHGGGGGGGGSDIGGTAQSLIVLNRFFTFFFSLLDFSYFLRFLFG